MSNNAQEFTGFIESTSEYKPTQLEYFAGLAMSAIIGMRHPDYEFNDALVARDAVQQAKALIAELEKQA